MESFKHPSFMNAGDINLSKQILKKIQNLSTNLSKPINIMHVCGTHEYVIAKNGLRGLLPKNINVISGPGCPVCVCPATDIEKAIQIGMQKNTIITTFGDMMRVPANNISLYEAKAKGMNVRVVYGPHDAVELAKQHPDKEVVFFAIGFETTAPLAAFELANDPPSNFSVICANKIVPPAMDLLLNLDNININGFLLPGHVCAIIGSNPFQSYATKYHAPMVVGGFEVNDVLMSIYYALNQIIENRAEVENTYKRVVKPEGNLKAQEFIKSSFDIADSIWRGIGMIKNGGLKIKTSLEDHDALKKFDIEPELSYEMPHGCSCDQVLIGRLTPQECPLFGTSCTPQYPIGPCMVSHEGSCKIAHMFKQLD